MTKKIIATVFIDETITLGPDNFTTIVKSYIICVKAPSSGLDSYLTTKPEGEYIKIIIDPTLSTLWPAAGLSVTRHDGEEITLYISDILHSDDGDYKELYYTIID